MLLNLHKKDWDHGLALDNYQVCRRGEEKREERRGEGRGWERRGGEGRGGEGEGRREEREEEVNKSVDLFYILFYQ